MDRDTLLALGEYLNEVIPLDTCDSTLRYTAEWLSSTDRPDPAADLEWIRNQGVICDCDVVIKLYLPSRISKISDPASG
jgi:hypothetical protein